MEFIDKMFGFQKRIKTNADDNVFKLIEFTKSSAFYIRMLNVEILPYVIRFFEKCT